MRVYIVMKNYKVDKVFDLWHLALSHQRELQKKWNVTEIIEREIEDND